VTQVIVALDVDAVLAEEELLERLKGTISLYKVGLRLFTAHGKRAVDLVGRHGGKVFLDLKIHDIPQTAAHAVRQAQKLGVYAVSLHLSGGSEMLRAAAEVEPRPKLWGVTVLTSLLPQDIRLLYPRSSMQAAVKNLAHMGWVCGIEGTICSGLEVAQLRKALPHLDMRFITTAIRPSGSPPDDQKRLMTPEEAARLGVDYIVIGRPITGAADPLKAAQGIMAAMKAAAPRALECE
jgi:orotidine-5'-phosphate decarboxylase